jgi:VWFA-related protein
MGRGYGAEGVGMKPEAISWQRLAALFLAFFCAFFVAVSGSVVAVSQDQSSPTQPASATTTATSPQASSDTQQDQSGPSLTIRQTVRRVIVDVMVRDKDGKPVHGLTAGDFSIAEDRQPQRVLSFDSYDFEKPSISRGPNAPPLPPNVFVNVPAVPERGPLYVLLLDLVNTEPEDQMTARQQLLKFVASKPQGTRFAIYVVSDELYLAQGFTDDKDLLYAALDVKHPKSHVPRVFLNGRNFGRADPYTLVDVLTNIGRYLDGIPGRKNLIWLAGTFPVDVFPRADDPTDLQAEMKAETNALAQAQIALFPVNVRGVVVACEGCLTGAAPHGGMGGQSSSTMPSNGQSASTMGPIASTMRAAGQGTTLSRDQMTQEVLAQTTGGRAFYNTNDIAGALEEATEDGGNYYTMTYAPPSHEDDGKCHNITVRLDKPGNQISYRRSYCRVPLVSTAATESTENSGSSTLAVPIQAGDVLQGNMKHGAPMVHDLLFSAHVRTEGKIGLATSDQMSQLEEQAAFFRTNRRNRPVKALAPVKIQTYVIDYRVLDPKFAAQAGGSGKSATLEFAVAAFDKDGKVQNAIVNDGAPDTSRPSDGNKKGLYRARQMLVVPVNAVSIRVGVRDRSNDRMGTLEIPLPLKPEPATQASMAH